MNKDQKGWQKFLKKPKKNVDDMYYDDLERRLKDQRQLITKIEQTTMQPVISVPQKVKYLDDPLKIYYKGVAEMKKVIILNLREKQIIRRKTRKYLRGSQHESLDMNIEKMLTNYQQKYDCDLTELPKLAKYSITNESSDNLLKQIKDNKIFSFPKFNNTKFNTTTKKEPQGQSFKNLKEMDDDINQKIKSKSPFSVIDKIFKKRQENMKKDEFSGFQSQLSIKKINQPSKQDSSKVLQVQRFSQGHNFDSLHKCESQQSKILRLAKPYINQEQ